MKDPTRWDSEGEKVWAKEEAKECTKKWNSEKVFFDGDEYFSALEKSLSEATRSVSIEMYTFEYDTLGRRIVNLLCDAAARGVSIRMIVDSIGSIISKGILKRIFSKTKVEFQVYHELPWEHVLERHLQGGQRQRFAELLFQLNIRVHRKYILIDNEVVFVGGMNISDVHLRSLKGESAWRDSAVCVSGDEVSYLAAAFERLWERKTLHKRLLITKRFPRSSDTSSQLVRLNYSRFLRKRCYSELIKRIDAAKKEIWITTAYFVPREALGRSLERAAKRGVDVRILLSKRSDVFFMPWVAWLLYRPLLTAGVKIFEYLPAVLHAKTLIIDQWMTVGTSNINSRSLIHDLEVDIVLTHQSSQETLRSQFLVDLAQSQEVFLDDVPARSFIKRGIGKLALFFRYWL